jgi:hypothetical protein
VGANRSHVLMMGRDLNDMGAVIAVMILDYCHRPRGGWRGLQIHGTPTAAKMGPDAVNLGSPSSEGRLPPSLRKLILLSYMRRTGCGQFADPSPLLSHSSEIHTFVKFL